ncbi:MAG: TonB-dependent receptor [Pseudomonadota bacterium]
MVTATKREAGMQDIPIAITTMSGEALEEKNVLSAKGLEIYTPGLRVPQQDASRTFVRIRGVGSRKFDIGSEGSVGIFVDEVYIPRFSAADLGFLDVERVEVLKGPQGTILGRNTAAGAINVTNRRPTADTEGFLEGGAGNEDSYLMRGAISGAVAQNIDMRLAIGGVKDGGMQENILTGNSNDLETLVSRLQTSWQANDTFSALLGLHYSRREQTAMLQKNTAIGDDGVIVPLFGSPAETFTVNDNLRKYAISEDGNFTGKWFMTDLKLEKEFAALSVISVSSFQNTQDKIGEDFDSSYASVGISNSETESDTYSQEFRLVGEDYLAGVFFYRDSADSEYAFLWDEQSLQHLFTNDPNVFDSGTGDIDTTSWAIFGEYTFWLSQDLSMTVGGRYSYDEKDFELTSSTSNPGLPAVLEPYVYADSKSWTSFDPKVAFTWQPKDDLLLYLSYNEGYKAGGTQFTAINEALARQLFDPEELSAYETGVKSDWMDSTLRLNASAFYYEYDDLQVQRVDSEISGGIPVAFTDNAASSDIYGMELDMTWLLPAGFSTRLAYAYLHAEYADYEGPDGENFSGNVLPVSPEHTVMFSLDYRLDISSQWQLYMGTDWVWVDDYNFDVNEDPATKQESYALGAATVALSSNDATWTLSAFVQNLTDKDYYSQRTRRDTEIIASAADGRRYGVRVKYAF